MGGLSPGVCGEADMVLMLAAGIIACAAFCADPPYCDCIGAMMGERPRERPDSVYAEPEAESVARKAYMGELGDSAAG